MAIHNILTDAGEWLRGDGPHHQIVISSRVRLARNLQKFAFPGWAKKQERLQILETIKPRVEEILEEVRALLDAAGFDQMRSQQVVLTGGASQIPGLDGLAARILGQNVRLGRPLRVQGLPQAATGPAFASSIGLCLFAAHPQDEWWDFEVPADRYPARSLRRAVKWFKDNW